jgi:hypothetical protein
MCPSLIVFISIFIPYIRRSRIYYIGLLVPRTINWFIIRRTYVKLDRTRGPPSLLYPLLLKVYALEPGLDSLL